MSRILTAIAANRKTFGSLDYAVFDDSLLEPIGLVVEAQAGKTPDPLVNTVHYDITQLTVGKIIQFANVISDADHDRLTPPTVKRAILEAFQAGVLDRNALEPEMLDRLE